MQWPPRWAYLLPMLFAAVVMVFTSRFGMDDLFPVGIAYRGLPVAWLVGENPTGKNESATMPKNLTWRISPLGVCICLVFWSLPGLMIVRVLRKITLRRAYRRQEQGLCPSCGYDLRGSGDVCPECGQKRGTLKVLRFD